MFKVPVETKTSARPRVILLELLCLRSSSHMQDLRSAAFAMGSVFIRSAV